MSTYIVLITIAYDAQVKWEIWKIEFRKWYPKLLSPFLINFLKFPAKIKQSKNDKFRLEGSENEQ